MMTRTDELIKKEVVEQLLWDVRVDPSEIQVEVENGCVTLSGQVPTYVGRSAAFDAAWSVAGVSEVKNHVSVQRHRAAGALPPDDEIRERITKLISWNPGLEEKEIKVKVLNGVVLLEGTVDAHWKRQSTEELAANVLGVADIRNELVIVPSKSVADKDLAREVVSRLERTPLVDAGSIEVTADNGVITLSGKVSTHSQRAAAMEAASHTLGVTEVRDKIEFVMVA